MLPMPSAGLRAVATVAAALVSVLAFSLPAGAQSSQPAGARGSVADTLRIGVIGPAIKAALESRNRTYYSVTATYEQPFSKQDKDATTQNMLVMGIVKNGMVPFAYPKDAKRNLLVQRKQ